MNKRLFTAILCILIFAGKTIAQSYNRPIPPALFPYQFNTYTPTPGYYFISANKLNVPPNSPNFISPCPAILDANGYVVWYLQNDAASNADFKYFDSHGKMSFTRQKSGITKYFIMDDSLHIIDSITNVNNTMGDGHEFLILANGNYLLGSTKDTIMDLSAYVFNGTQGSVNTTVKSYVVQEFDSLHNLVFEWNSIDHVFPTETYDVYGYNVNGFDYCHGNAIEEDIDGNILVSFRHLDAVYKIDHLSGSILWILGGRSSNFTFTNDVGFGGQHDVRRLPNGDISMFDNTNNHAPPHRSRGVQFTLDTINWTATRSWEYIYMPSFFTTAMGNNQLQTNGDHLINYGMNFRPHPSFVLIDNSGNLLTETFFMDSVMDYRTHFYDMPFNFTQPEVSCTNNGTTFELFAPVGYDKYIWNTGDTTLSIIVTQPDTFMVWVNYGEGMIGSLPFFVNDLQNDCLSGIETTDPIKGQNTMVGLYDLLGREIPFPIPGQMYIALYSNGTKGLFFTPK